MNNKKLYPGQVVTVFATVVNSDGSEGRGQDIHIGYFWDHHVAMAYGQRKDVMGTDGRVAEVRGVVDETFSIWINGEPRQVNADEVSAARDSALAKARRHLSPQELNLLGLDR